MVTFGRLGFCGGCGGVVNVGLVPAPFFSIFVAGVIWMPMLYPVFSLMTMCLSSLYSDLGISMPS